MNESKITDRREQISYIKFMQISKRNRALLNEIRNNKNNLTPFIGAGLSIDFNYPSWLDMFTELCKNELDPTSDEYARLVGIFTKINNGEHLNDNGETFYTRMADIVFSALGKGGFLSYIENLFKDKNSIQESDLWNSAAYSVARTFRGLCLTTNLDRIMDRAYALTGRVDVFSPGQEEQIKQLNRSKQNKNQQNEFVFHLHGSVSDIFFNPERVILTTESYRSYYFSSSKNEFLESIASAILFYIGVNLENDEPFINFFMSKLPSNRYHYAIYSAPNTDEAQALHDKLLNEQKIKALIFPKGEFSYVKLIIDWLNKDNPTEEDIKEWLRYNYDNYEWLNFGYIDGQGNTAKIMRFLDDPTRFSFIEIVGANWSGKTMFAEEIEKKAKNKNWTVIPIDSSNSNSLRLLPKSNLQNILYVLDDSTSYLMDEDVNKFGDYLRQLSDQKRKVRVVFIHTALEKSYKWWENSIATGFGISSDNYLRERIFLEFTEEMAYELIIAFVKAHWNVTIDLSHSRWKRKYNTVEKLIAFCSKSWREFIDENNESISNEMKNTINTPFGCNIMMSILLSDTLDKEIQIKAAAKKLLLNVGIAESEIENFFIWIKKYMEQYGVLEMPREAIDTDLSSPHIVTLDPNLDLKDKETTQEADHTPKTD